MLHLHTSTRDFLQLQEFRTTEYSTALIAWNWRSQEVLVTATNMVVDVVEAHNQMKHFAPSCTGLELQEQ